eukprot:m.120564 g.120564  ORF g.120564 m.120564 type:complete len:445 (+) comp13348_c0_seq1:660-1994(+)
MLSNTQLGVGSILLVLIFTLLNLDSTPPGAARPHVVQIEAVEGKSKQLLPPNDPDVWMQQTSEKKQTSVDDLIEKIGQITDPADLRRLRARLGPDLALSSSADPPKTGVSTGASTSRLTCGEDTTWIAPYYPRDPKYSALESQYAIPLTIWQTTKSREVKKAVCLNVKTTLDLNPEFEYRLQNDTEMMAWLEQYPTHLANVRRIKSGAFKADYWRYVVVAEAGGVYFDFDATVHVPLTSLIQPRDTMVTTYQRDSDVCQFALMAAPKNPIFVRVLARADEMIRLTLQGESVKLLNPKDLTGPTALKTAYSQCKLDQHGCSLKKESMRYFYSPDFGGGLTMFGPARKTLFLQQLNAGERWSEGLENRRGLTVRDLLVADLDAVPAAPLPTTVATTKAESPSCSEWDCSCQKFSNLFDTWPGHWGKATGDARGWWVGQLCTTRPKA